MSVSVVNESPDPFRFTATSKRGQGDKFIAAGAVTVLSDQEWQEIPIWMRGPGGINPIDSSGTGVDSGNRVLLDYFAVSGINLLRYEGSAPQGALATDPVWTIKRFAYTDLGGLDLRITDIQTLRDQPWGNTQGSRDALGWT